jgi:hypothetical protein
VLKEYLFIFYREYTLYLSNFTLDNPFFYGLFDMRIKRFLRKPGKLKRTRKMNLLGKQESRTIIFIHDDACVLQPGKTIGMKFELL